MLENKKEQSTKEGKIWCVRQPKKWKDKKNLLARCILQKLKKEYNQRTRKLITNKMKIGANSVITALK